jgi:hypothetical protein
LTKANNNAIQLRWVRQDHLLKAFKKLKEMLLHSLQVRLVDVSGMRRSRLVNLARNGDCATIGTARVETMLDVGTERM